MIYLQSLLERAKPELLDAIESFNKEYPNTVEEVVDRLKSSVAVSHLPYGTICDLRSIMLHKNYRFDINNPWELFDLK